MCDKLRAIGILGCLVSTVLFMAGGLTDHWVSSKNGHWGLWEICDESEHNVTKNDTTFSTTAATKTTILGQGIGLGIRTTPSRFPDSSEEKDDEKEDKKKKKEEEEESSCTPLSITSLPAFLHIVRAIMVLAGIVLAWGLLSGRSIHWQVPRGDTFFEMHQAESVGCFACVGTTIALIIMEGNYKSVHEDTFTDSRLDYSFYLVRLAVFMYFPGAILMMSPTLQEKFNSTSCSDFSLDKLCVSKTHIRRRSRSRPSSSSTAAERSTDLQIVSMSGGRRHSLVLETNTDSRIYGMEGGLAAHDLSLQLSDTDSDIFTVTMMRNEGGGGGGVSSNGNVYSSTGLDLPSYEDVARVPPSSVSGGGGGDGGGGGGGDSSLPPPPSYQDVVAGGYLTFAPPSSDPSAPLPSDPSSASSATSCISTSSGSSSGTATSSSPSLPPPPDYYASQA